MAINVKRLLKLAAFLETVPREAFTIKQWEARAAYKPEGKVPGDCGFAGCAVGWAAHAKLYRGFSLKAHEAAYGPEPSYKGQRDWAALNALFGFEPVEFNRSSQAEWLFFGARYKTDPTPKQVSQRIREFVREHSPAKT